MLATIQLKNLSFPFSCSVWYKTGLSITTMIEGTGQQGDEKNILI
jgi:hypothetical protein